jgi:DNA-binding XRE family transcriptional regulator
VPVLWRHPNQGGSRIGDPRRFAFAPRLAKGTETGPNITRHLPPSLGKAPTLAWPRGRAPSQAARRPLIAVRPHRGGGAVQLDLIELLGGPPAPRRIDDPVLFGTTRDARIARNLTQAQAAALAGISRSALGNIETGTFPAGLSTQVRLAAALGLPLAS